MPSALEAWSLNHWITREVPLFRYLLKLLVRLLHGFLPAVFPMSLPRLVVQSPTEVVSNCLQPHQRQHTRILCPHYILEFAQTNVH